MTGADPIIFKCQKPDGTEVAPAGPADRSLLEANEIWAPDGEGLVKFIISERRWTVSAEGGAMLTLIVSRPGRTVAERLDDLPGDWPMILGVLLASITLIPLVLVMMAAAFSPVQLLGWMAANLKLAVFVVVVAPFFWLAIRQKTIFGQYFFGQIGFVTALVAAAIVDEQIGGDMTAALASGGYEALGRLVLDSRESIALTVTPWAPAAAVLINWIGWKSLGGLIGKFSK